MRVAGGEDIEPMVAVIAELPVPTLVARPWLPAALLIVATVCVAEDQTAELVTLPVLLSEYVAVAVNC